MIKITSTDHWIDRLIIQAFITALTTDTTAKPEKGELVCSSETYLISIIQQ